jgi:hypothetical protein
LRRTTGRARTGFRAGELAAQRRDFARQRLDRRFEARDAIGEQNGWGLRGCRRCGHRGRAGRRVTVVAPALPQRVADAEPGRRTQQRAVGDREIPE